ncbi:putative oxidoreductase [Massariosphaeria phaeospora]|uniref:Putative oxidoreductase n=1 Tax=Massariosphaeria phaeospora TaxID=100035 RepID=A0A7C8IBR3_9PLEO|nr:putative oxidoreductase [Massariosphaeria phaeospora]
MFFNSPPSHAPFPSDLPTAEVPTLSSSKILDNDIGESQRLYEACCSTGLFFLDLRDSDRGTDETIFELDIEEKQRYSMLNGTVLGYKGAGVGRIDSKGTQDRCEFWCMSKDDVLEIIPALPAPEIVNKNRHIFATFARSCHTLSMTVFDCLEHQVGLPVGAFRGRHRIDQPSSDQSRQIRYLPQPEEDQRTSLVPHTDYGSVTVLFNVLGGLQILPAGKEPEEQNWLWVKPGPGCAIINLGDAMEKFSNGLLKSPMHRVTYAPGEQSKMTRYSLAYFTRPEDACLMKRLEGSKLIPQLDDGEEEGDITAGEWVRTRMKAAQVQKDQRANFPGWETKGLK